MSCYNPLIAFDTGCLTENGKPKYAIKKRPDSKFLLEAEKFDLPLYNDQATNTEAYGSVLIPCGKCLGCRLDYSRRWADRMMLELESNDGKGMFLTLTYDDDHVPIKFDDEDNVLGQTVDKRDSQLFLKNLRKEFDGKHCRPFRKIRFYCSSEYGPLFKRPHLHIIVFGLDIYDLPDCEFFGFNKLNEPMYHSELLDHCWAVFDGKGRARHFVSKKGFVVIEDVTYNSCAYVARYTLKKALDGDQSWALSEGLDPEFSLMSRRPGIGADYLKLHPDCLDFQSIPVPTKDGMKKVSIPKYFLRHSLDSSLISQEKYDKILEQRKQLAIDKKMSELSRTSLFYLDYLDVQQESRLRSIKSLSRDEVE